MGALAGGVYCGFGPTASARLNYIFASARDPRLCRPVMSVSRYDGELAIRTWIHMRSWGRVFNPLLSHSHPWSRLGLRQQAEGVAIGKSVDAEVAVEREHLP